jgi:hypothetical protein
MKVSDHHRLAALDNAELCAAMWHAHGHTVEETHGLIACSGTAPRLYPNVVTVDPGFSPADQTRLIGERARTSSGAYFVKDSFDVLELDEIGFEPLFRASWIRRRSVHSAADPHLEWRIVTDPVEELESWEQAWSQGTIAPRLFVPEFLTSPGVSVLAGRTKGRIVAGCIVTSLGPVVGISNVFGAAPQAIRAAAHAFKGRDLVGYEQGEALAEALAEGFEITGSLTVWHLPSV